MIYYSLDSTNGNTVYENNRTSNLSEFSESDREILLNGGEVEDVDGSGDYVSIHIDEE